RGGGDDRGVLHRACLAELVDDGGDGRLLLPDGDVEAVLVLALLVDDGVDGDRGLAGLAVADDELAVPAADRDHRVDRLDGGLERLVDRLPGDDAGRLDLDLAVFLGLDGPLAVDRDAERVDHAADQRVADGHAHDLAGAPNLVALADGLVVAEEGDADVVLLEVQDHPHDVVAAVAAKLEELAGHRARQAVDAG